MMFADLRIRSPVLAPVCVDISRLYDDPVDTPRLSGEAHRECVRKASSDECVRILCGDLRDLTPPEGRWRVIANPHESVATAAPRRSETRSLRRRSCAAVGGRAQVLRRSANDAAWLVLGGVVGNDARRLRPTNVVPASPQVDAGWLRIRRRRPPDPRVSRLFGGFSPRCLANLHATPGLRTRPRTQTPSMMSPSAAP